MYYNLCVLSQLTKLKNAYYELDGVKDRTNEHTKLITHSIDLVLSAIERYNFYEEYFEMTSKYRIMNLVGFSCGIVI